MTSDEAVKVAQATARAFPWVPIQAYQLHGDRWGIRIALNDREQAATDDLQRARQLYAAIRTFDALREPRQDTQQLGLLR